MRVGFGFSSVTFRPSRVFHSRVFKSPQCWVLEIARITKHSKCCDKFFVLTMSLYAFISLLYKQELQYTLLKSFTVPSALSTKFPKKFHTKLLASAFIFTKLSTKTLFLWHRRVSFEYQGQLQNTLASFCFLSMFKLHCKRHYRNLATYSWWRTTWREHVTKTASARRRHAFGGGAAAHSFMSNSVKDTDGRTDGQSIRPLNGVWHLCESLRWQRTAPMSVRHPPTLGLPPFFGKIANLRWTLSVSFATLQSECSWTG